MGKRKQKMLEKGLLPEAGSGKKRMERQGLRKETVTETEGEERERGRRDRVKDTERQRRGRERRDRQEREHVEKAAQTCHGAFSHIISSSGYSLSPTSSIKC